MALSDFDTSVVHSFGLEIDGVVINGITEVSGLALGQDVIELKQNTSHGKYIVKKLPGRPKAGEVTLIRTLIRGVADGSSFEKWVRDSRFGDTEAARKNGAVVVYDNDGQVVRKYQLTNMRQKSLEVGAAGATSVLTEKLVVTYENLGVE
ncbi:phage tail protein [Nocardia sp. NPDC051052]|uniref:phage tail protein n=1 Tax=Nocardia sp. NPDC051052 TaxID=3364322 RepID=UPI00378E6BB7